MSNKLISFIKKNISVLITITLFILMFIIGSILFRGFFSAQVFYNLFIDNAFMMVTAAGMTMVIITGGIDLSVGSVIALTTMVVAHLSEKAGINPAIVILAGLSVGTIFGLVHGIVISVFNVAPFIVTLAGMFLARGLCYIISTESITINNELFQKIALFKIPFINGSITFNVIIAIIVLITAYIILEYTRFGRTLYAIGGNEQSAMLMGLGVKKTKVIVYTTNGFLASLSGIVFSLYMLSGYSLHAQGGELDTIASCVIGGTLLSGGVGNVIGTLFGVLILGVIQTLIMFQGTLSSWWTRIAIGILLLFFILFQTFFIKKTNVD
ncbi:galactofuranose ABC transporter, permease protein YjfF [uncultured Brachyspira sp.]|uniref:galactofuranose ABC transporter, permease protein YjfF n=1 Tax=uncultured Brachyspira sp. TaxID=221953 RepID=UPI002620F1C0|nr:galactofuranose ABC transporter, permease protein YjfF [uncultured Brachyspira sp.]